MSEIVTGTPAVVGFTNGNGYNHQNGWDTAAYAYARSVDAGEQTRDLLGAIAATNVTVEKTGAANTLATYVAGAANSLAIEKIGAAQILESAKNTAAIQLQATLDTAEIRLQASVLNSEMRLENGRVAAAAALAAAQNQAALAAQIAECCCEQKALVLSIDAHRIRDELALLQTQFLVVTGGVTPSRARLAA